VVRARARSPAADAPFVRPLTTTVTMASSRAINQQGIERVSTVLSALGAEVEPTGTTEIHLLARYAGARDAVAIAVKATTGPQPGGGHGKMALHWLIKDAVPADQIALVDLASHRVWLMTIEEVRTLAQQHSGGQHHLIMVVERQERSKHARYLVEHFDEFLLDNKKSAGTRPAIARTEPGAGLDESIAAVEGELRSRMVRHRVRERELREAKLAEAKRRNADGRLRCEVPGCGFDFEAIYGPIGVGYAQVHHLRPLSEAVAPVKTTLNDLAVVCANCHAMIHIGGVCRSLADLIAH
jgi:5-methylcytosine-specific restriction endonuclease McrA